MSQGYSALDAYIQQPETHEQTALGYGTTEPEEAVKIHTAKMEKAVRENGRKLPK
jgi:hypothetical protein